MNKTYTYSLAQQTANETITARCFSDVELAQQRAQEEFGIVFGENQHDSIPYYLIGPIDVTNGKFTLHALTERCRQIKSRLPSARVNLLTYFDVDLGIDDLFNPPCFDSEQGVNTIYPDEIIDGWCGPSEQDIFDNIICETIRAKYDPIEVTDEFRQELAATQKENSITITEISSFFNKYGLFHRAPTDGAIMIDSGHGPLISQTRTNKINLQQNDFSLVTSYSMKENTLDYAGMNPPSSDSPELLALLKLMTRDGKGPQLAIHFHHPTLTRSKEFSGLQTLEEIEYGRFASGRKIYDELRRLGSIWLILKHHGFLWLGDTTEELEQYIQNTLKLKTVI